MKFFNWSEIKHKKTTTNITKKINSKNFISINDTKHIKILKSNSYFRKFQGNFFEKKDKESSHLLKLEINLGKIKNKKSKYDDLKSNISKTVVSKTAVSKTSLNKSINSLNTTFAGNLDFNSEVINEKRTKDALKRLLKKSNDLLNTQNGILAECDELAKNVNSNDIEIENLKLKQDNDNFPEVLDNYSKNLNGILGKLKKDSVELEEAKQLREENKSLKYKIQILSIDKSDDYLNIEAKLNSVKNIYSNEINSMINFFDEIGLKDYKTEKMNSGNFSEDKVISFFSL